MALGIIIHYDLGRGYIMADLPLRNTAKKSNVNTHCIDAET